ncbi:hypothetical protein TS71_04470 [Mycolicibacterium neoaurum]|uniref:Uncharacterized protein n=1 Tax=Mycolicibacterium neoaurum VKM Ac-1815D TaxID=700508 RepID=V5XJM2_MYCNE|nr:hypothetical protein D174_06345 [Mycolicibacterium neoaurum VKM Ac-1815D]AMO04842.1 hypothetical protein MyAD_06215 [Mycolicibacterium neoaurum]AXK76851.1 hypothetical protein DXK33_18890 [Mycolicibacterium neoaurum]KJQ51947.1 hypothetical protein TS71_04470 [Mycolicibacterium neoaurum]KUM10270.1 hypothetical protein AVZ31_00915 [Mycolicibacterium neoaurum]
MQDSDRRILSEECARFGNHRFRNVKTRIQRVVCEAKLGTVADSELDDATHIISLYKIVDYFCLELG